MADENQQEGQESLDTGTPGAGGDQNPPAEDPIKNLKSEFSRKFDNQSQQFAQINQTLQTLAQELAKKAQPAPTSPQGNKKLSDLMFEDPDAAAEIITTRAVERADVIASNRQAMQQRIFNLTSEFPELASEENQNAVQRIHSQLPANLQNTAEGAELALTRAAMQLGLTPSSKRRKTAGADDSYIPPSGSSPRRQPAKDSDLNDEQATFAHLLNESIGRKMDDNVQKNLKKYAQRKTWSKYGTGEES